MGKLLDGLNKTGQFGTENQAESTYFQIMRLRLSSLSNWKENTQISNRAIEILNDIKNSNMSPFECIKAYWDETISMKNTYFRENK